MMLANFKYEGLVIAADTEDLIESTYKLFLSSLGENEKIQTFYK
jgi:hypothetical protein